jgi:hypothetical protein
VAWRTILEKLAPDISNYLGVFDSIAQGVPTGGGASYACNETIMGFVLDIPGGPWTLKQATGVNLNFNAGGYASIADAFGAATTPGNLLIAVFTATFLSALFNVAIADSTSLAWSAPYPDNGHVPGESNSLQVFFAISGGGTPTVTITQTGFSNITTGALILLEYQGPGTTITDDPSAFLVGPGTLTIPNATTASGDLLLEAISIIPACPNPDVSPIGGGVAPPPFTSGGKFVGTFVGILSPGTIGGGTR